MTFIRPHHKAIGAILEQLDPDFLEKNNILFGGGTRTVLGLDEYRESGNIELFCVGRDSYSAARRTVTHCDLGQLLKPSHDILIAEGRDIRTDRDAIRTFLKGPAHPIKLEIFYFNVDGINVAPPDQCVLLPSIDITGCFTVALMANADHCRHQLEPIFDLCMMRLRWGSIPREAWESASNEYSEGVILNGLKSALRYVSGNAETTKSLATELLKIEPQLAEHIINVVMPAWLAELG